MARRALHRGGGVLLADACHGVGGGRQPLGTLRDADHAGWAVGGQEGSRGGVAARPVWLAPHDRLELHLRRELDPEESDEEARERLMKLARNLWAEMDAHRREDGWSEEQVDDWLKERDKRDVVK